MKPPATPMMQEPQQDKTLARIRLLTIFYFTSNQGNFKESLVIASIVQGTVLLMRNNLTVSTRLQIFPLYHAN